MKVIEDENLLTFCTDIGEIGLAQAKGDMWYILFEGFIPMSKYKITSITFTKRDEYEEEGWLQGHQTIAVREELE